MPAFSNRPGNERDAPSGPIPVYVINLDRSPDRLEKIRQSATRHDIAIKRVPAVDGAAIDIDAHGEIDAKRFARINGRPLLAGEAGCYLSHIEAIQAFVRSKAPMGLICEDDVEFTSQTYPFLAEINEFDGLDVIKLFSFRTHGFRPYTELSQGRSIGRCRVGPVGSAAAYAVSRAGAQRLLASLRPMILPYDVALERGWHGDVRFFLADRAAIQLQPSQPSTIASRVGYGRAKYPFYRRGETLIFRALEAARRLRYSLSGESPRKMQP